MTVSSNCLLVTATIVLLCGFRLSSAVDDQPQQLPMGQFGGLMRLSKVPDLIDFEKFQQIYHKHYPNLLVKMARANLFAVNAFKAFVTCVQYIWHRSTKFLVVNTWSDSTVEERRKFFTHYDTDQMMMIPARKGLEPTAELEDVEQKLDGIVEHRRDNELYGEIAAELERSGAGEKRITLPDEQQADHPKRDLSIEDPMFRMPSKNSNPHDKLEESPPESLPADEAREIVQESGDSWFTSALKSATSSAAAAIAKYSPLERPDPGEGKTWIIHSHPRADSDETVVDQIFLDYNDSGCMAPIQDQGLCGCCYALATIALFEYHYCNQTKTFEHFSKQYAIDCGLQHRRQHAEPESIRLEGCSGGREDFVALFFDLYGIKLESEHPFKRVDGQCPVASPEEGKKEAKIIAKDTDWTWLDPDLLTNEEIKFHLQTKGPVTISTHVYYDMHFYGGGVDLLEECDRNSGHAMNLIGYGIEDGLEYWLIRNSMGTNWGARGHWKLSTAVRKCLKYIGVATPKFILNQELGESSSGSSSNSSNNQSFSLGTSSGSS